eukprot:PhF_6_TR13448/c1_g2_i5/m.21512/K03929/pnbA; para-nitrobenzyl esterase
MAMARIAFVIAFIHAVFATVSLPCGGKLLGLNDPSTPNVTQYRGIRFATPPVGVLRWQYTVPLPSDCYWDPSTVMNASQYGAACMQGSSANSEDCLYLDVHTPATTTSNGLLPVFFWLYGGSNIGGSSHSYNNLSTFAAKLGAVVVAPNFRVNTLGFLAHRVLTQRSPMGVSGNYGISDIIAALEWTQRNVRSFGGDPSRVT